MNKWPFYILGLVSVALSIGSLLYSSASRKKIGFVTTEKLYEAFEYRLELQKELTKIQSMKQSYLDSLKLKIQLSSISADKNQIAQVSELKKLYLQREQLIIEENDRIVNSYNEKIWTQINQYVEDYGKSQGYDFIFGANGSGNIMYASNPNDLTEELIKYINAKYKGGNTKK